MTPFRVLLVNWYEALSLPRVHRSSASHLSLHPSLLNIASHRRSLFFPSWSLPKESSLKPLLQQSVPSRHYLHSLISFVFIFEWVHAFLPPEVESYYEVVSVCFLSSLFSYNRLQIRISKPSNLFTLYFRIFYASHKHVTTLPTSLFVIFDFNLLSKRFIRPFFSFLKALSAIPNSCNF